MMKIAAIFALSLFVVQANANQGVFGGLNMTEYDADGVSYDSEMGFEFGYTKHYDFGAAVMLRTGVGYVQKNSSQNNVNFDIGYLEIPVTALYSATDMVSLFGGLNLDLQVTDDCPGTSCDELDSFVYNLVLGGQFKINDMYAVEASYEMGMSEIAEDVEIGSSLGARFIYWLN